MAANSGPYDRGELRPHDSSGPTEDAARNSKARDQRPVSWFAVARSLKLQGPTDMSVRIDAYLNGEVVDAEE